LISPVSNSDYLLRYVTNEADTGDVNASVENQDYLIESRYKMVFESHAGVFPSGAITTYWANVLDGSRLLPWLRKAVAAGMIGCGAVAVIVVECAYSKVQF